MISFYCFRLSYLVSVITFMWIAHFAAALRNVPKSVPRIRFPVRRILQSHQSPAEPLPFRSPRGYNIDYIPSSIEVLPMYAGLGTILVARPQETNDTYIRSTIFIYHHDDSLNEIRGIVLERPTPFLVGEIAPGMPAAFYSNSLFMGGDDGDELATVLHTQSFDGSAKNVGAGVYMGGLKHITEAVEARILSPKQVKFITKSCRWTRDGLFHEIAQGRWGLVKLPPSLVIGSESEDVGSLWERCNHVLGGDLMN